MTNHSLPRRFITPIVLLLIFAGWMFAALLCDLGTELRDDYQNCIRDNQTATEQEYAARMHLEWLELQRDEAQATLNEHVQYYFENAWPDGHRVYNPWPIGEPAPSSSCTYCQNMSAGIACTEEEIDLVRLQWSHWDWMIDETAMQSDVLWAEMELHEATCQECQE